MSLQELCTNPIFLGVAAAVATYAYLYWDNLEKQKKHPKLETEISMMTPIIIGLLVFVIAYNLFGKKENIPILPTAGVPLLPDIAAKAQCNKFIDSKIKQLDIDSATFHLVGKNAIRLPQADVFIDLAKF